MLNDSYHFGRGNTKTLTLTAGSYDGSLKYVYGKSGKNRFMKFLS